MKCSKHRPGCAGGHARGFSLLEVMIALTLLALGLTMIATAFPVGMRFYAQSIEDTRASILASSTMAAITTPRTFARVSRSEYWSKNTSSGNPTWGSERTHGYVNLRNRIGVAIGEAFLEAVSSDPMNKPQEVQLLRPPGSSRDFDPRHVQYFYDHDGTASPLNGSAYTRYPFLHRRAVGSERNLLTSTTAADSARKRWAIANERIAQAVETSFHRGLEGMGWATGTQAPIINLPYSGPIENGVSFPGANPRIPLSAQQAQYPDRGFATNNALLWLPFAERIDRNDVVGNSDFTEVLAGRYISQIFYRQLDVNGDGRVDGRDQPPTYLVLVAVQRNPTERPFRNFRSQNPVWASSVSYPMQGWHLHRPSGPDDNNPWDNPPIDFAHSTDKATDSNVEAMNRLDEVFGRIRLHELNVNGERVTSVDSVTDNVRDFEPGLDPFLGGFLICHHSGTAYRVIGRDQGSDRDLVLLNEFDTSQVPAGRRPAAWAIPRCVAVYSTVYVKRF